MKTYQNKQKKEIIYELFMLLLASFSIGTIWKSTAYDGVIVWVTWGIFFVDFIYRLIKSDNKWGFIKNNPFLVIAAIPLDAVFQFARFARILHLLRLKTITKYYTMPFIKFLQRQHLGLVVSVTMLVIFLSIIPLYILEPNLESYWDALVSSLMTITFFGQSDFETTTLKGHIIIVLLTVFGVILHGIIISTCIDYLYQSQLAKMVVAKMKRTKTEKKENIKESGGKL
ncbi:hypothetical protein [Aquibacillus albus]|uniref:Voltage-gated potassium channel n=1 Tax=Aquibacillus albus TaxID=1168171 RepID=A0ABS2MVZ0_9BACI|nr:hypothetical protein [Aquibacillus albus]MBM7570067.1 voltage-gated potassium channel [Aquibacillus albus]